MTTEKNNLTGETKTAVYLSEEDALLFVQFMKYYDVFKKLIDGNVFMIQGSSATLHFDNDKKLRKVEVYMAKKYN